MALLRSKTIKKDVLWRLGRFLYCFGLCYRIRGIDDALNHLFIQQLSKQTKELGFMWNLFAVKSR